MKITHEGSKVGFTLHTHFGDKFEVRVPWGRKYVAHRTLSKRSSQSRKKGGFCNWQIGVYGEGEAFTHTYIRIRAHRRLRCEVCTMKKLLEWKEARTLGLSQSANNEKKYLARDERSRRLPIERFWQWQIATNCISWVFFPCSTWDMERHHKHRGGHEAHKPLHGTFSIREESCLTRLSSK